MRKKIGIIGLGIMGHGMAVNFLRAGYELSLWNRSPERAEDLVTQQGARLLNSPRAVTEASDIVFEVLADDESSRAVWLGNDGILAGATTDKTLITSASLSISWTEELANSCKGKGFRFLDMPLTGSRKGAETGTLKLLVGGDITLLDEIRPDLAAIADKIYHFGKSGSGMRFKLILNVLQAIQINAAVHAIELAKKTGLNINQVHDAIFDVPMGPASINTGMAFQSKDIKSINFTLKLMEKDLRYAQDMAAQLGIDFDLLNSTQADYAQAKTAGLGDEDWTKITEIYSDQS